MADAGWDIAITDISTKACQVYGESTSIEEILKNLGTRGAQAKFYEADLTDEKQAIALCAKVEKEFGPIQALVALAGGDISGTDNDAAGGKAPKNTAFVDSENFHAIFDRNFLSCVYACRAATPFMVSRGMGKVITFASVSAGFGVSQETAYAVAKAGVAHFTRCLASELRPDGINVNCLAPGGTNTGRFRATLKDRTEADLKRLEAQGRLERVGEPEDVCKVIEFFLSSASNFISGQVLRIDGGQFTGPI
jgi:3-oxoacyl-[acyl-carrier protein] reductase